MNIFWDHKDFIYACSIKHHNLILNYTLKYHNKRKKKKKHKSSATMKKHNTIYNIDLFFNTFFTDILITEYLQRRRWEMQKNLHK